MMEKRVTSCSREAHPKRYLLRITRDGPSTSPFGWQISGEQDSLEIARSTTTFPTLLEAMADSVRVALPLELEGLVTEPGQYLPVVAAASQSE